MTRRQNSGKEGECGVNTGDPRVSVSGDSHKMAQEFQDISEVWSGSSPSRTLTVPVA